MSSVCWNILVDFDGTLHKTEYVFASKLDGLFGMNGIQLFNIYLLEIHRKIVHLEHPLRHDDMKLHWSLLLNHLGISYDDKKANLLSIKFKEAMDNILRNPLLFPDAQDFLKGAAKKGYTLCLSTGENSQEKAEAIEKALGNNYFHYVIGEDILGHLKNEESYYKEALRWLRWKAENTISIGDTILTDILPAKKTGIRTMWINRKKQKSPNDIEGKPDYELCNLLSALDFLEQIR